jgi:hypothetical protein
VSAGHETGAGRPAQGAAWVVVGAVALRPWLWATALAEAARLAPPGWWRRWPPLPFPDPALWRFRMETAYGGTGSAVPERADVVSFLEWCSAMRQWRRR